MTNLKSKYFMATLDKHHLAPQGVRPAPTLRTPGIERLESMQSWPS